MQVHSDTIGRTKNDPRSSDQGRLERNLLLLLFLSIGAATFQIGQLAGRGGHTVAHASAESGPVGKDKIHPFGHRASDATAKTHLGARVILDEQADPPRLRLDLTADAVDAVVDTDAPAKLMVFEPAISTRPFWEQPNVLTWKLSDAARATKHQATVTQDLMLKDGTRLPAGSEFTFSTTGPRVLQMEPYGDLDDEHAVVHAAFDLPIPAEGVRKHLSIHDSENHPLDFDIAPCPRAPDGEAWHLTLDPSPIELAKAIEVEVGGSLTSLVGEIPLGEDQTFPVRFLDPLQLERISARSGRGIEIDLNRSVALPDPQTISLEPKVPFQIQRSWRGIQLIGDFPPGDFVRVTLAKGFPGHGRARLDEERSKRVKISDLRASLSLVHDGKVLSTRARPEIEISGVNVDRYAVGISKAYPNNVLHLMREGYWRSDAFVAPEVEQTLSVIASTNETFHHRVDLTTVLGEKPRGVYVVTLRDPDYNARTRSRLVQVTDLRVSARVAETDAVVHVTSIADGSPRAGAEVRVLTRRNQLLAEAVTNPNGIARLSLPRATGDRTPFLIEALYEETRHEETGDDSTIIRDQAWVDLAGYAVQIARDGSGGAAYLEEGAAEAFIAFDRGVARPGETHHATCLVRDDRGQVPVGTELIATWTDAVGRDRKTIREEVPPSGLLAFSLETAASDATGPWELTIKNARTSEELGKQSVRVDTVVPDRIEVETELLTPPSWKSHGSLALRANWLAGGGVAHANATVRIRYEARRFQSDEYPQHEFDPIDPTTPPGALPPIRTVTDQEGVAQVALPLPLDGPGAQDLRAKIEVEVEDPSGRPARAHAEADLEDERPRCGIRYHGTPNQGTVDLILVANDGALAPIDATAAVEIRERSYVWERIEGRSGRSRWERIPRTHVRATMEVHIEDGLASVPVQVTPNSRGLLFARAVLTNGSHAAESVLNGARLGADVLNISSAKRSAAPGSKTTLRIHAPFAGRALLTLEGRKIHHSREIVVPSGDSEVELTIPSDLPEPNLHAVCVLSRPQATRGAEPPFLLVGSTPIAISHPERSTAITLDAPEKVEPETRVSIDVHAPDASSATVALVDVGVLQLTRHPAPAPGGHFLRQRRLSTVGADTATGLLSGAQYDERDLIGGGGEYENLAEVDLHRLDGVSDALRTIALFSGVVPLDSDGRGEVSFSLPPYEGRLRAVVIAAGTERIGSTTRDILVEAPLSVLAAAPRILTTGDRTVARVTVRNRTGATGDASIEVTSSGDLFPLTDVGGISPSDGSGSAHSPWTQAIENGKTASFDVPIQAGPLPGSGELVIRATLGGYSREISLSVPVRSTARRSSERIAIASDGSTTIPFPGEWQDGTMRGELHLTTRPTEALVPAAMSLMKYPYGCCEQTSSRGVAVLAARELVRDALPDGAEYEPDQLLSAAAQRVLSMQTWDGGFSMWPGRDESSALATLVACDFLTLSSSLGMRIPDESLRHANDHLRQQLDRWARSDRPTQVSWATWAAEVLSRVGHPIRAVAARLAPHAKTSVARARLALALQRLGDTELALDLLSDLDGFEPRGERDDVDFGSPVIARAWLLRAILECAPKDPRAIKLADALKRDIQRPGDRHTQELSHALLALRGWFDAHQPVERSVTATITMGDREVVKMLSKDSGPLRLHADGKTGDLLTIRADGPVFGSLILSGFRVDPPPASIDGLHISRSIIDESTGEAVEDGVFRRGQTYRVEVVGQVDDPIRNLLVIDPLPAGIEPESQAAGWFADQDSSALSESAPFDIRTDPDHTDRLDDRVLFHVDGPIEGRFRFTHRIRAVFPGTFSAPPIVAEALYKPGASAASGEATSVVIDR